MFLRENWDEIIVLKSAQAVQDSHAAMDARVNGLTSNHGTYPWEFVLIVYVSYSPCAVPCVESGWADDTTFIFMRGGRTQAGG